MSAQLAAQDPGAGAAPDPRVTFSTRVKVRSVYPALDEISDLLNHAKRHLFVDRYVRGKSVAACKKEYLTRFGITARQFNAISRDLAGQVRASREAAGMGLRRLRRRIAHLDRRIRKRTERLLGERDPGKRLQGRFVLHQKKRHLGVLRARLSQARLELRRNVPPLCFGSRKAFVAQFHLRENGYASHGEWLEDWRLRRCSSFLCLGSGDEAGGNQTATLTPVGGREWRMRLRVPPALEHKYGRHVVFGVEFPYGHEELWRAWEAGLAITVRFVRKERKGEHVWYVHATTDRPVPERVTSRASGALGVDFNRGRVVASRVDRCGNPLWERHWVLDLEGKTRGQRAALLGEVVADIVELARREGVPVVIERLDFEGKKAQLREMGKGRARRASAFAYRLFHRLVRSGAARKGVEVIEVDPAYTTVIGLVKFAGGYRMSVHGAAAVAIARRGLGFGERLCARLHPGGLGGSALPLPVRNRGRHVLREWGRCARRLRAHRARGGRPCEGKPDEGATPIPGGTCVLRRAQGPPGDGPPSGSGEFPPAQRVGSAVRPASQS